jgi:hypothetical protein
MCIEYEMRNKAISESAHLNLTPERTSQTVILTLRHIATVCSAERFVFALDAS